MLTMEVVTTMLINSSISEQEFQEYLELIEQGYSQRSACDVLSLSRSSVQRYIKKLNELNIDGDTTVGTTVDDKVNVLFLSLVMVAMLGTPFIRP